MPTLGHVVRTLCSLSLGALVLLGALASGCGGELALNVVDPRPSSDHYVEALVARARAKDLAHSIEWLRLGHYRQGLLGPGFLGGGYESQADGVAFFLSSRGKRDPQAELDATLRAFFLPLHGNEKRKPNQTLEDVHAICRFPARFSYLSRELGIDPSKLEVQSCPAFQHFYELLDPRSVTLVFSSYFLNNPASAFGHTFLRINKANTFAIGKKRELLDYGVDFSADVDSQNALIYAFKGLTGLFPGTFKQIPYYYKVREYNDTESRDLWEYDLALSPEQVALLVAHMWEVGNTYFDYYYLSENCSYHILSLVEVVTPELDLTAPLSSPVLPTDTVKVLARARGLVRDVHYRPSLRTQFRARVQGMSDEELDLVDDLVYAPETPLPSSVPDARKIAVLDAAADLVDVRFGEALIMKSNSDAAKLKQRLLERRAAIQLPSEPLEVPAPQDKAPEVGHGSHRAGIGATATHGTYGATLDLRVNLHDLADPANGYPELSAIEFFHVRLQMFPDAKVEADDIAVFRVTSLNLQTRFDRKLSWKIDTGATTLDDAACTRCFAAHIGGGVGMTFAPWSDTFAFFVFSDLDTFYAPSLSGIDGSGARVGVGPFGGLRWRLAPTLVFLGTGEYSFLPWQSPKGPGVYRADAIVRWQFLRDVALSLEGRALPNGLEAQLMTFSYF